MEIKLNEKKIKLDAPQIIILKKLEILKQQLETRQNSLSHKKIFPKFFNNDKITKIWRLGKVFKNQQQPKSLYIYGEVGRGKSMLMMNFFHQITLKNKIHYHFNSFMQDVHRELHQLRKSFLKKTKQKNNLIEIATKNIIGKNKLLCFDEFQVEDIADAMILNQIFSYLFKSGVSVVFTSNSHPRKLYKNGLQRDLFLKFVKEILEKNCEIINLNGEIDYRSQYLHSLKKHYFYPNNSKNKKEVLEIFEKATDGSQSYETEIELLGRKLKIKNSYKNIALFDFKELCESELGVADYQAICQNFSTIFLLNIPILKKEDRNEAKRLILFIDEVYENKIDLIILSDAKPEEIYIEGVGSEAFKRAASRLNEITHG